MNLAQRILRSLAIFLILLLTASLESALPSDTKELEQDVNRLLQGDQVVLRRNIDKVFKLAKIREEEGKEKESIQLYERGLEVNASNLPSQMMLAKLLAKQNRKPEAISKTSLVIEYAEDEELLTQAESLAKSLGQSLPQPKPVTNRDENVEIMIIPLGHVNDRVISSLRDLLELRMGIRFSIYPTVKEIGSPDRSFKTIFIRDYFKWLKERIGEDKFPSLISELGFSNTNLETDENKLKFFYTLFERMGKDGQQARDNFESGLKSAEKQMQYDLSQLFRQIQSEFPLSSKARLKGYMAVINEDLFEGDSRFRFGGAILGYAVISMKRFTSDFNNEDQNRPRLVTRFLKQALSSANFALGIPRCTNPNCARAYPNSLQELDQKPDTLCSLCQERLLAYRRSAGK